jgi:hypothetical protein
VGVSTVSGLWLKALGVAIRAAHSSKIAKDGAPSVGMVQMTMWKDPEAPHAAENLSKTIRIHLIRAQIKK